MKNDSGLQQDEWAQGAGASSSWRGSWVLGSIEAESESGQQSGGAQEDRPTIPVDPNKSDPTDEKWGLEGNHSAPQSAQQKTSEKPKKKSRYKKSLYYCKHQGCIKTASFSYAGQRRSFCSTHKKEGMIDVYKPMCKDPECKKKPSFNMLGEKRPKFCAEHKLPGMVDVVKPKCLGIDCMKRPSFNYEGEKRGLYCGKHRLDGMVDVVKVRCEQDGCTTRASYNELGKKRGRFCAKHSLPEMVQVENSRCEHSGCHVWPSFNYEGQRKKLYCAEHKLPGMVRVQKSLNGPDQNDDENAAVKKEGDALPDVSAHAAGPPPPLPGAAASSK
mmetsp:Transcript_44339/g.64868  ORF Transcript_44339/g.64868 Transcript_44339/m.64868 type:complete len:329 (+) Transcript_44339:66-1052(+)